MSYLIREENVPTTVNIYKNWEGVPFLTLQGKKCIGREEICYRKSELISLSRYKYRGGYRRAICISDRIYFIIDGEVTNFRVGDEVYQKVTKGDIVFIPKGVPYSWDWGELEYIVMNGPAFIPGSDKTVQAPKLAKSS